MIKFLINFAILIVILVFGVVLFAMSGVKGWKFATSFWRMEENDEKFPFWP